MHSSLNLRKEYFNGDDSSRAVIIGDAAGEIYAVDPTQVGTDAEISISRKAFKAGTFQKYLEISIAIVGIPLIIAMIGGLMVVVGCFMWRTGENVRRVQAFRIALLQLQQRMVKGLPRVRCL